MAQRKRGNAKSSGYTPVIFLICNLDVEDKMWLDSHPLDSEFPLAEVLALATDGYKVSITPDRQHKRYICSLVDKSVPGGRPGHCISGSGAIPLDAWHSLAYRHFVKLERDWSALHSEGEDDTSQHS